MKDVVVEEIVKELNWKERIIVKVFRKTFIKVVNVARIKIINKMLQKYNCIVDYPKFTQIRKTTSKTIEKQHNTKDMSNPPSVP